MARVLHTSAVVNPWRIHVHGIYTKVMVVSVSVCLSLYVFVCYHDNICDMCYLHIEIGAL